MVYSLYAFLWNIYGIHGIDWVEYLCINDFMSSERMTLKQSIKQKFFTSIFNSELQWKFYFVLVLKEPGPIASYFFQPFEILVSDWRKLIFFLISHNELYNWKMYRFEDINENVTSYGNHKFSLKSMFRQLKNT